MSTDQDWARDLFERSRAGEEPAWVADHAEMARAGRRRGRTRTLAASGSAMAAVAVTAAVGLGVVGSGVPSVTDISQTDPQLTNVFDYVASFGGQTKSEQVTTATNKDGKPWPKSTASSLLALTTALDPEHAHLHHPFPRPDQHVLVADDSAAARNYTSFYGLSQWTADGRWSPGPITSGGAATQPTGMLEMRLQNSAAGLGAQPLGASADTGSNCGVGGGLLGGGDTVLGLQKAGTTGTGYTETAKWTKCTVTGLPDGSRVMSSMKSYDGFEIVVAARVFPGDTGAITLTWSNFVTALSKPPAQAAMPSPDPTSRVSPSPWTRQQLVDALSAPGVVPGLTPAPPVTAPAGMLKPSDFGAGWSVDAANPDGQTGALVVEDGCVNEQNMVAKPEPEPYYLGKTPSGIAVTAFAGWHVMQPGSGPSWMAELRKHGTGGCDQGDAKAMRFSQDTMSPLPAGTGDDAFIENWVGQGNETIFVRVGDSVLRLTVTTPQNTMPAFTQADKDWFAGLAAKAVARHAGKG